VAGGRHRLWATKNRASKIWAASLFKRQAAAASGGWDGLSACHLHIRALLRTPRAALRALLLYPPSAPRGRCGGALRPLTPNSALLRRATPPSFHQRHEGGRAASCAAPPTPFTAPADMQGSGQTARGMATRWRISSLPVPYRRACRRLRRAILRREKEARIFERRTVGWHSSATFTIRRAVRANSAHGRRALPFPHPHAPALAGTTSCRAFFTAHTAHYLHAHTPKKDTQQNNKGRKEHQAILGRQRQEDSSVGHGRRLCMGGISSQPLPAGRTF